MEAAVAAAVVGRSNMVQLRTGGGRRRADGDEGQRVDGCDLKECCEEWGGKSVAAGAQCVAVVTWPFRIMMLAWKGLVEVSVAHRAHAVPVGMDAIGRELLLPARRCSMACATSSTLPSPPHTMTTSNLPSSSAIIISYLHRRSQVNIYLISS